MITKVESWLDRRTLFLARPRAHALLPWLVPLLLGLLSVLMGQDDGWDMRNYHLYNVHSLLHGRMGLDISPAGFQTYFNPTLDLPYFLLTEWLPPQLVAFLFGAVQGLNFLLVLAIARSVLGTAGAARQPMLLAVAGILGAGFLSELGNCMGDNLTALLILWPLQHLLQRWDGLAERGNGAAMLAGAVMGLGVGLKLTNAVFAVALCMAVFCCAPGGFLVRLRLAFLFGIGVLGGAALTGGWWMVKMWQEFGNPLFPQFNNLFHSPMASEAGVLDLSHLPRNLREAALWPFIFTRDMARVSEVPIKQAIWPVLYVLFFALGVKWLVRRGVREPGQARGNLLLVFVAVSYLVWLKLFSIYRYLVPAELLAPLAVWVLLQRLLPPLAAQRLAIGVLGAIAVYVLPFTTWGHAEWAERSFSVQVPPMAQPASTIVYMPQWDSPTGWMAQSFAPEVQVIGVGTGFPESQQYHDKIVAAAKARSGPHYALFLAAVNPQEVGLRRKLDILRALGQTDSAASCARMDRLLHKVRFKVQVKALPAGGPEHCTLELQPQYRVDLAALDRANGEAMAAKVKGWGLVMDLSSCQTYQAAVGRTPYPYRLCRVAPAD
jgi:hypothetical protein